LAAEQQPDALTDRTANGRGARHEVAGSPSVSVPATPVDHGWLDDGHGVLSCVAGDEHTPTAIAACPYYLRTDVVAALDQLARPLWTPDLTPTLLWRGEPYHKITRLAGPQTWPRLVTALPATHGLRRLAWSLFSELDAARVVRTVDPRDAFRAALADPTGMGNALALLGELCALVGDPGNRAGLLGLTGSAALDPALLGRTNDIDLMVYPGTDQPRLLGGLRALGARFLADLHHTDPRRSAYLASRLMPPTTDPATLRALYGRRHDVAWVDDLRIDLTYGGEHGVQLVTLPYTTPPTGRYRGTLTVTGVEDRYPVVLHVADADIDRLLITARGYQGAFRPGDRIRVDAAMHRPTHPAPFASVDDAAGHTITLLEGEEHA